MKEGIQAELANDNLRKSGCYFLCLLEWAARDAGKDFTKSDVDAFYDEAVNRLWMEKDCFINNAPAIYNAARGKKVTSTVLFVAKDEGASFKTCIAALAARKKNWRHFVLRYDGKVWDPLPPSRSQAAEYEIESFRFLI